MGEIVLPHGLLKQGHGRVECQTCGHVVVDCADKCHALPIPLEKCPDCIRAGRALEDIAPKDRPGRTP
jgi:hypothetical protein